VRFLRNVQVHGLLHAAFIGQQPSLFGPCLLRPNGRPSQQLLSSCFHLRCTVNIALVAVAVAPWIVIKHTKVIIILNLCFWLRSMRNLLLMTTQRICRIFVMCTVSPAYPTCHGKEAVKRVTVCLSVLSDYEAWHCAFVPVLLDARKLRQ